MPASARLWIVSALLLVSAACSDNNNSTSTTTPSCTVTAGAITSSSFSAAGGTGSIPVTAGTGCTWTATSSATFVTVSAGGSGNGTVTFTVAPNTGAARTATLTVAGTGFTISQSAASAPPSTPGSLSAPTASSPVGGQTVTIARPTLVVNNAVASGTVGTVTYRFEISDQSTFPNDPVRNFTVDGIAQGAGTTSWTLNRDLGPDVLWYWHARATDGVTTSAYSPTETFRTPTSCTYTISPTTLNINSTSATATIAVTTGSGCGWTATTTSPFITFPNGASGTGSGGVLIAIPDNPGPSRTGTVTIAGQTFTVTQAGASVAAAFQLLDPSQTAGPTTNCQFRSGATPPAPTTCVVQSTSVPLGTASIVNYSWTVQYTYGTTKTITQSGASPSVSFTDTCGQTTSTSDGIAQPLSVMLTITDSSGNTATVTSGTGGQPALFVRLFTCGS
ncbi:MAG TPA: hypothetical protein VFI56_07310 [Vicinamibacterales bacterium]|nr:hypothetical protein [Vicinamibacterales bacterium]